MDETLSQKTQSEQSDTKASLFPIPQSSHIDISSPHQKKNLYPAVRHILLVVAILLAFSCIIFLMHQNGKSIYDNGI